MPSDIKFFLPNRVTNTEDMLSSYDDNGFSKIFGNYFFDHDLFSLNVETRDRVIRQYPQEYNARNNIRLQKSIDFYNKCLIEFEHDDREYNVDNAKIEKWSPEDVVELLNERKIIFILGSIGCGKSTYIEKVRHIVRKQKIKHITRTQKIKHITKIQKINKNTLNKNHIILDFNVNNFVSDGIEIDIIDSFELMNETLINNFKDRMVKYLRADITGDTVSDILKNIEKTFRGNIVLVFDALDKIYDAANRHILEKEVPINPIAQFINSIIKAVDNSECFSAILCTRPSTFKNIASYNCPENQNGTVSNCYPTLIAIKSNLKQIINIVDQRFECHKECDYVYPKYLKNNLRKLISCSILYNLHGLRHLMKDIKLFTTGLKKIEDKKYHKWIFDIFCMLGNKETYGQNKSNVYNIFLINAKFQKDTSLTSTNRSDIVPDEYFQPHHPSYWLKYFILARVFQDQYKLKEVEYAAIKDMDDIFNKFQKHIYKLCIYSLSEVKNGRLLSCEYRGDSVTYFSTERLYKIFLNEETKRKDLTGEHIEFFSFIYLALVVDDSYMLYPNFLQKHIEKNFIYENIFIKSDVDWWRWLEIYVKKVFIFILVIESSLMHYERHFFTKSFYDENKPDFNVIKQRIIKQIKNIGSDINISDVKVCELIDTNEMLVASLKDSTDRFFKGILKTVQ